MKISLIRHGEKEGDEFQSPLTQQGRKQIEKLAQNLNYKNFIRIYSSSNLRSIESAKIIAEKGELNFKILDNLREFKRTIFFEDFEKIEDKEKINYQNLISFIEKINEDNEDVCLVMNAGINRLIMCHLLRYPLSRAITLTQDLASITELEKKEIYGKRVWCINSINTTFHKNDI